MAVINYHPKRAQRYIRRDGVNMDAVHAYMIEKVNQWMGEHPTSPFMALKLVGRNHGTWIGTPMEGLYRFHVANGKHNPVLCAGIDAGWLLLEALQNDPRTFRTTDGYRRQYRLV